ncbi:MAG TPA: hypothetical protein PK624_13125 [Spirochaetota bacterium]|nr:hypothetical protein [Spirochaetota bacterium]HOR45728.1 hypothetical protein [Spirochaetota bacterium]HPK56903.1 hypothetical protein [Spirochaetota bacterium]
MRKLGLELSSGITTAGAMSNREGISPTTFYKWQDKVQSGSVTTDSRHNYKKYSNIPKDILTTGINQVITGDDTTYNIKGKDHFCAALLDRYNHETIGRAVSDKNDTEFVLTALGNAHFNLPDLNVCIHYT